MPKPKHHNPVAKFAQCFNRCAVYLDKKKRDKQGYVKHKKAGDSPSPAFFMPNAVTAALPS